MRKAITRITGQQRLWFLMFSYQTLVSRFGVTSTHHANSMNLSPSLSYTLKCPKRYHLERTQRTKTLAPFASSSIGQIVHKRIATSLKTNTPANTQELALPKRLLLQENQDLNQLCQRAQDSLTYFNDKCLPYLKQHQITHVEHRIKQTYTLNKQPLNLTGVIDCIIKTTDKEHIIDWKTSSATHSQNQLRFYLKLRELETKQTPKSAEAISLSQQNSHNETPNHSLTIWFDSYLTELLNDLQASQSKEAKSGKHCTYCPYAHTCENSEAPTRYMLDTWTGELIELNGGQT